MSIGSLVGNERRRAGFAPEMIRRVVLVWAVVATLQLVINSAALVEMRFPDPDDTLRLVQVRDWIAGQSWFDVRQYRIDAAGGGAAMHWSRLVDFPIAAIIVLLAPLIGQPGAELVALVAVPMLTLLCAYLLIGRIAWKLFDAEVAGLACLACGLAVPLIHQMRPLRIDHHGWQIVAVLAALNGLMARDARRGGWAIGGSLGVLLSISIEGLPLAAAICGITALKWLRNRADYLWMVHAMCSLAAVSAAVFVATRGVGDLVQHCDAISPVHLGIFAWGALATTALAALRPHPRPFTGTMMTLIGIGGLLILRQVAPQCGGGAFVEIDPLVRAFWYERVLEGRPLWEDSLQTAATTLGLPLFGVAASLRLAADSSGWLRRWWIDWSLILCAAILVTLFVSRAGATACAIAAIPMGWQLREWIRAVRRVRDPGRQALALSAVILALAPTLPISLFLMATPSEAGLLRAGSVRVSTCKVDEAAVALRKLPRADILAPLDIGPRLIYATPHSLVATGHHRAATGMHDVVTAFISAEAVAHRIVRQREIDYVALCPDLAETMIYASEKPGGFAANLRADRAPSWLEPVRVPGDGSLKVWRVVR